MKSRPDYDHALQVIREVVHRWDPYQLLRSGSPPDEFDCEIAAVARQIPRIRSKTDAAHALSRVFSSAFERERFSPEACAAPGAELYQALSAGGLLDE